MPDAPAKRTNWLTVLGWACYLACSWTWCIGMFLPVLLIRDYGIWGFVVFAVPNMVGAAAMGWVLRKPGASTYLRAVHATALGWFSTVTASFQVFFAWWLIRALQSRPVGTSPQSDVVYLVVVGLVMVSTVFATIGQSKGTRVRPLAIASIPVWFVSVAIAYAIRADLQLPSVQMSPVAFKGIACLAPVCAFGFALCPYLDQTFHLARQALNSKGSPLTFTIAFGFFFLAMILFTLGYAHLFLPSGDLARAMSTPSPWVGLLAAHVSLQLFFTVMAHFGSFFTFAQARAGSFDGKLTVATLHVLVLLAAPIGGHVLAAFHPEYHGLNMIEVIYRLFMSFYGLLFPAYVWLCMIPTWRNPRPPTRRHIRVWLGACALAAPAYWMGFIERQEWWLIPGLAAVLLARLLIPRDGREPGERSGAPVPAPTRPPQLIAHAQPGP